MTARTDNVPLCIKAVLLSAGITFGFLLAEIMLIGAEMAIYGHPAAQFSWYIRAALIVAIFSLPATIASMIWAVVWSFRH